MTRRIFIMLSFFMFTRSLNAKRSSPTYWQIIDTTLNHIFPRSKQFAGASALNLLSFFKLVTNDKYFDKDDLKFLIKGAKILYKLDNSYTDITATKRENILREFEKNHSGERWLSTLIYYGFEAMLADPIYDGNHKQKGWKALSHNAGFPRPKNRYGKNYV